MGHVILFAQQKGGAGKTTLLTQLAVEAAGRGKSVALLDLDPQRSSSSWHEARTANLGDDNGIELVESAEWRARSDMEKAAKAYDLVFVDAPGSADTLGKVAMRAADFVLIPCQPSMADVWASRATLDMVEKAKLPHSVVLNRVPPRSKAADAAAAELRSRKAPLLKASLGARAAFVDAFMQGSGVTETAKRSRAAEEITALAKAIQRQLSKI